MRRDLDDLAAFSMVARELSFTRAAAALRLTTSALSYRIKKLEQRLNIRLLQRNSRSVSVTEAGARLLETLNPALANIDHALEALGDDDRGLSGTIRLTATRQAFESIVQPVLPNFCRRYPNASVEVLVDYQFRDIISERLDTGIRLGEKLENDMIAVNVGSDLCMAVVASPDYLAERPGPETPQELTRHRCINYRMMASGSLYAWEFEKDDRALEIQVDGALTFNEPEMMLQAALDGVGVAYLVENQAKPYIKSGRLIRFLEDWTPPFPGYYLYYPSRRHVTPTFRAFVEMLRSNRAD